MRELSYTLDPGHIWQRLILVKDRRTRRPRKLAYSRATMRHQTTGETLDIPTTISYEGGIDLCLTYDTSLCLTAGVWDFDAVGDFRGAIEPIAKGTITVSTLSFITSLEGGQSMSITYDRFTDYRQVFTWLDVDENTIEVSDARMQAKDGNGVVVLDLSFYLTPPDETAIGLLDPEKRGYLSPSVGATLEMHISDQNTVAAGSYTFDLLAKEDTGDWGKLADGILLVEESVTDPHS